MISNSKKSNQGIVLSKKASAKFMKLADNPDPNTVEKRNDFIKGIKKHIVVKKTKKSVTVVIKEKEN